MDTMVDIAGVERRARVFGALSDANRLRIVELLIDNEEVCGKDAAQKLGISLSLYSHHSRALREAGILVQERRGQKTYCSLDRELLDDALNIINRCPYPPDESHRACDGCREMLAGI